MKKKYLIVLVLSCILSTSFAQENANAVLRVYYAFNHIRDTVDKEDVYKERMMLMVGEKISVYKSYDGFIRDSTLAANRKPLTKNINGTYVINSPAGRPLTRTQVFKYLYPNKMTVVENLLKTFIIQENSPEIQWKILNDTLTISGLRCQKATGYFKGRTYTAWFTPEIPFNTGPWKLCGLPGLILEAYDSKREVEFLFDGLKPVEKNALENIQLPKATSATRAEFARLVTLSREDPAAFFATTKTDSGATFTPSNLPALKDVKRKTINNPLELKP